MPRYSRSLRLRLAAAAIVTIASALAAAGWVLVLLFERHVERRAVGELETNIRELIAGLDVSPSGEASLQRLPNDQRFTQPFSGSYWQVSNGADIVARSRSLWDEQLSLPSDELMPEGYHRHLVSGPKNSTLLAIERMVTVDRPAGSFRFRLAAAIDRSEISATVTAFRTDLAVALLALGTALLTAFAAAVSVGLAPLQRLQTALADLRSGAKARLSDSYPAEVTPLVDDLNRLLESRERSIEQARARSADLAHGLKTPLTAISVLADELRERGDPTIAQELIDYVTTMQRYVERELALARSMTAGASVSRFLLRELVDPLVRGMRRLRRGGDIEWTVDIDDPVAVKSDKTAIAEVVGNLLDNARKWARGRVRVSAAIVDGRVKLEIADDGPGVAEHDLDKIIGRGKRLDETVPGSGFGLSIAAEIAEQLGTKMEFRRSAEGGLSVGLALPAG